MQYQLIQTQDGSITLSSQNELMHHTGGALSETIYVYEPVIKYVVQNNLPLHFLCVGLGLGYIEIMLCAFLMRYHSEKLIDFKCFSYEPEKDLYNNFVEFFSGKTEINSIIPRLEDSVIPRPDRGNHNEFAHCYLDIISRVADYYKISSLDLEINMQVILKNENLTVINEPFTVSTKLYQRISGVFFDAYSPKSSPELWKEDLFQSLFNQLHDSCCFATYASRTDLKKILKKHNFILAKKAGYKGKRECTFACREMLSI